jgi:hypothetical protein
MSAQFVMHIERADGQRLRRKGTALRLTRGDGIADRLFVIRSPTRLDGLALLSKDVPAKPAAQWLYLPTYRRARRIAIHGAGDAYVGSDFYYADLGRVRLEAGRHRLKGDAQVAGRTCMVVDTTNMDRNLPYARFVSMLDRQHALPLRIDYYDENGHLTRKFSLDKITTIRGWPTPLMISVDDKKDGGRSIIKLRDVRYDVGLSPGIFTVGYLEQSKSAE